MVKTVWQCTGSLLALLSQGKIFEETIPFAVHADALATRGYGVIDTIPEIQEVIDFMNLIKIIEKINHRCRI